MRIVLSQLNVSADPRENERQIVAATSRAAGDGADLVVFPEASMKAFNSGRLDEVAEPLDGQFATALSQAAQENQVTVIAGMFTPADTVERDGKQLNRVHNTLLVALPDGDTDHYHKIHLFDAFGFNESDTVAPGNRLVVVDIPLRADDGAQADDGAADGADDDTSDADSSNPRTSVSVGLATCFDIRFPEQFVHLAELGAEVIVVPASWNDGPGKVTQWQALVTARALDSTTFVAACDVARPGGAKAAGEAEGPTGVGHSMVVAPDGLPIATAGYDAQQVVADIDLQEIQRLRKSIPVLEIRANKNTEDQPDING